MCRCGIGQHVLTASSRRRTSPSIESATSTSVLQARSTPSGVIDQGRILPYRSSTRDCMRCDLKPRCTTARTRKVSRDIDEDVRDYVRSLEGTEAFAQSCVERKKVEMR